MKKTNYTEPESFFPKSIRKKAGIGEYAKKDKAKKDDKKATTKNKKK